MWKFIGGALFIFGLALYGVIDQEVNGIPAKKIEKARPQKSEHWMSCKEVADDSNMGASTRMIRCKNKEVVCYWERDAMQCSFNPQLWL